MSWINERLRRQRPPEPPQERRGSVTSSARPAFEVAFEKVTKAVERDVLEFNQARGPQYLVSIAPTAVQVIPKQTPMDTTVIQVDQHTGTMRFDCPISHPGVPRRGQFDIRDGSITPAGDFVGPQPSSKQMTPDEVSEFILGPLLFPE
jgi:hypothetical protein